MMTPGSHAAQALRAILVLVLILLANPAPTEAARSLLLTTDPPAASIFLEDAAGARRLVGSGSAELQLRKGETSRVVVEAEGWEPKSWEFSREQTRFGVSYESDFRSASKDRHKQNVNSVEYSPDGKYVLSGSSDGTAVAWDPARRVRVVEFKGRHNGGVNRATFHPSGRQVATASDDGTIKLWDAATGKVLKTLPGHQAPVRWVEFSPDGRRLLSTGADGSTRLWDVERGEEIVRLIEGGDSEYIIATPDNNARGAESLRDTVEIEYTGAPAPADLHVAVIGVSEYSDPAITDLRFAAKDAADIAQWFGRGGRRFRDVRIHRLVNEQATRENILALKEELMASAVDDQVVLFLAGHGFLDSKLDYYFATADMVAANPAGRGLPYEQIEDLLDGIPARNKLLLMDTCHAGELDKDDTELVATVAPASGAGAGGISRGAVSVRRKEKGVGLRSSFALMQGLFVNLSRGSGAVAIAAAGGAEYAWEDAKWGNGAFTYSILEGLESGNADSDGDGEVRVTELRDYVARQVSKLTQGRQQPTVRRENVENDFPVH